MPEVVVYESVDIVVYQDIPTVVLNTAPNLTGIDEIFNPIFNIAFVSITEQFFINMV